MSMDFPWFSSSRDPSQTARGSFRLGYHSENEWSFRISVGFQESPASSFVFRETSPYRDCPVERTIFMEKSLAD